MTKKVLQHTEPGCVYVTQEFSLLMQNKMFIWETFDWQDIEKFKLDENSERIITLIRNE